MNSDTTIIACLTNNGQKLLTRMQLGYSVRFTKVKIGDGNLSNNYTTALEEAKALGDLINTIQELSIFYKENLSLSTAKFTARVNPAETGYYFREIGLFALDPDTNKEILYAYGNKGNEASYISPNKKTNLIIEDEVNILVDIGDAQNVTIVVDGNTTVFQSLTEKGQKGGYAPLDNEAKVPLEHLPSTFVPFCFNSGLVDENGEAALLQLSTVSVAPEVSIDTSETEPSEDNGESEAAVEKKIITLKSPAVYTDGNGKTVTITEDLTLDVTDFVPGTYSLRVQETSSGVEFIAVEGGKVYKQKNSPENPQDGDLWQNLSVAPHLAYIYTVPTADEDAEITPAGIWQITNQVEVGVYTVPAAPAKGGENSETAQIGGGGVN